MRLHLLLLLSVVYLAPAACQIFPPPYPGDLKVLQNQAEAITTAFKNNDTALIARLIRDDLAGVIKDWVKRWGTLSVRAVSASTVVGGVHGIMVLSLGGIPTENMESRLIRDSGSPTGFILVGLGPWGVPA